MITTILIGMGCFIGGYVTCALLCVGSQGDRDKERWDAYQDGMAAGEMGFTPVDPCLVHDPNCPVHGSGAVLAARVSRLDRGIED